MKKLYSLLVMALLVLSVMPVVMAVDTGGYGVPVDVKIEEFEPLIWMCDYRVVMDDPIEWGRQSNPGDNLIERMGSYAFEGEKIKWDVLAMDKNKIEQLDVYMSIDESATDIECKEVSGPTKIPDACNARIGEEELTDFNSATMAYYVCEYTVRASDEGETLVTIEVDDGITTTTIDENEYWFFNPAIGLAINDAISFEGVRPGTTVYSDTLQVRNAAEDGSGVMLDMFIAGDDFEGEGNCPNTNVLALTNFRYYATKGAYSTQNDPRKDTEGYVGIGYGDSFDRSFYNTHEILQMGPMNGPYYMPNVLAPNDWITLTFRLNVPEPCNGVFDEGQIQFWGEAI